MQATNSVQIFKKIHNVVEKDLNNDSMFFFKGAVIGGIISLLLWVLIFWVIVWLLTRIGFWQFDEDLRQIPGLAIAVDAFSEI